MTFADDGSIVISGALASDAARILGLRGDEQAARVTSFHLAYMRWHRARVFRREVA